MSREIVPLPSGTPQIPEAIFFGSNFWFRSFEKLVPAEKRYSVADKNFVRQKLVRNIFRFGTFQDFVERIGVHGNLQVERFTSQLIRSQYCTIAPAVLQEMGAPLGIMLQR